MSLLLCIVFALCIVFYVRFLGVEKTFGDAKTRVLVRHAVVVSCIECAHTSMLHCVDSKLRWLVERRCRFLGFVRLVLAL